MRLLHCDGAGRCSLTEPFNDNDAIPSYAILSHTWGEDSDEVNFNDLINGTGTDKLGYEKIRFCAEQAKQDGLRYFWIDTCCINKENKAELTISINSMFRWYRDATRCYVFLSDVSAAKRKADSDAIEWEPAFRKSKWFTRGWTLQELLAPYSVEFFSQQCKRLGDKRSLRKQIHEITAIPEPALDGELLSQFSVNDRRSWIEHRNTKLEEDKAYALFGIFGISMPVNYGEGKGEAFRRLEDEIKKLQKCMRGLHITDPKHDKARIEENNGGLLEDSYLWILEKPDFQQWRDNPLDRLLWIKGDPGKGKTMLLCGIINELGKSKAKTTLLSYFFCQATDSRINNATSVLRGLIYMLIYQEPLLVKHIRKEYDRTGKALFENANAWIALSEIFKNIVKDPTLRQAYLVVDALDECVMGLPTLLDLVTRTSFASSRVKWMISSRNWPDIEARLEKAKDKTKLILELNEDSISSAVRSYIEDRVELLATNKKYSDDTKRVVRDYLHANANGTFLWVALMCKNLDKMSRFNIATQLKAFPPGLDSLYKRMMQRINESSDADLCKRVLATITVLYRPTTLQELTSLVEELDGMAEDLVSIRELVDLCGSFLTVRNGIIYFVHQSAKDFLLNGAFQLVFPSGVEGAHYAIFSRSLLAMSGALRRDMYKLDRLGCPIEQVKQPEPDPLAALRYCCIYWIEHLCEWSSNSSISEREALRNNAALDRFLRTKYLYWLEALSLCRSMSQGLVSMEKLDRLIKERPTMYAISEVVRDARRYVMYHKSTFENSPLQVYAALLFTPTSSVIRMSFKNEEPKGISIKPEMNLRWDNCLQTFECGTCYINSVAFSHDSKWIAWASTDHTAQIWDVTSGVCLQTLEGHGGSVNSVAFSHDSTYLASASDDDSIKIWDIHSIETVECLKTLKGHIDVVTSVAFSHDSTLVASAAKDATIKIWNVNRGECLRTLRSHCYYVNSVAFSHDSTWLVSASGDETIDIWDAHSYVHLHVLESCGEVCNSVAFSHDSTRLASASDDCTITIWDTHRCAHVRTLCGHKNGVNSITFSHDSTWLASASGDATVKLWDTVRGDCLRTFEGHTRDTTSVCFSHNSTRLVSASWDGTIRIWAVGDSGSLQRFERHSSAVTSLAFSHDFTLLASTSTDRTLRIWDAGSGESLKILEGHRKAIATSVFSYDSSQIASLSWDDSIKIWDVRSGECLTTCANMSAFVRSITFSHDLSKLVSACDYETAKILDTGSGKCLRILKKRSRREYPRLAFVFSHDSRLLVWALGDVLMMWDVDSGEFLQEFACHTIRGDSTHAIAISRDSAQLASASLDGTFRIWNVSSGECTQTFKINDIGGAILHARLLDHISFDSTGPYLCTSFGAIAIGVPSVSTIESSDKDHRKLRCRGVGISGDGEWIIYNSERVLRLPHEYRPGHVAVFGGIICIGTDSGRVWMYDLKM